jgi:heat shock protein HslJ
MMRCASWLALMLLVAACSGVGTPTPTPVNDALNGTRWRLTLLHGEQPLEGTVITLAFDRGILSGSAGCNQYGGGPDSGPYQATLDGALTITQTAITVRLCTEPAGIHEQEAVYMHALREAATYRVSGGMLEIFNAAGDRLLSYVSDLE